MKRALILMLVLTGTAGCGKDNSAPDDAAAEKNIPPERPENTDAAIAAAMAAAPTELEGVWKSGCDYFSSAGFQSATMTVTGKKMVVVLGTFDNSHCIGDSIVVTETRAFEIGEDYAAIAGAKDINFVYWGALAVTSSAAAVDASNKATSLGYDDWAVGAPKDVSGRGDIPDYDTATFNIYKLVTPVGGGKGILFGDSTTGSGATNATRPTSLYTDDNILVKQ